MNTIYNGGTGDVSPEHVYVGKDVGVIWKKQGWKGGIHFKF